MLEWIRTRSGVDGADCSDKLVEAVLKCAKQPSVPPVLPAELFKGLFTSARTARELAARMEEAIASLHEAFVTAKKGARVPVFKGGAYSDVRLCPVRAPFVYLTTHGLRTRSLELDIADHRKSCKLTCPVQDKVDVSVADMGGQVGMRARG